MYENLDVNLKKFIEDFANPKIKIDGENMNPIKNLEIQNLSPTFNISIDNIDIPIEQMTNYKIKS